MIFLIVGIQFEARQALAYSSECSDLKDLMLDLGNRYNRKKFYSNADTIDVLPSSSASLPSFPKLPGRDPKIL